MQNSPALITPNLGTPTAGNLASCTFPILNQNTTGQAGTVATINGLIAVGSNITLTGSGTPLSPYTIAGAASGVLSFNARTGAVTLTSADVTGALGYTPGTGNGTVTSVALSAPTEFTVSGSPVTGTGTLTFSKANQSANQLYAGPSTGSASAPTFRSVVAADLPATVAYTDTYCPAFIGQTIEWNSSSSPPTGTWHDEDGSALSRTTYAALFSLLSTTFGAGDGSTTFNLPDSRSRTVIGQGTGTSTDIITYAGSNNFNVPSNLDKWITGMQVTFNTTGTAPGGLTNGHSYYIIRVNATTIQFAPGPVNSGVVTITSSGSGTFSITQALETRSLAQQGGEENHYIQGTETPLHSHDYNEISIAATVGALSSSVYSAISSLITQSTGTTTYGNSASHNNVQPYIVKRKIIRIL